MVEVARDRGEGGRDPGCGGGGGDDGEREAKDQEAGQKGRLRRSGGSHRCRRRHPCRRFVGVEPRARSVSLPVLSVAYGRAGNTSCTLNLANYSTNQD